MTARMRWLTVALFVAVLSVGSGCRAKPQISNGSAADAAWPGVSFIEDDYEGALQRARAEHRLLFVDAWAPWCHTCLSMKAFVFNDPALAGVAPAFVWAAVDTEKDSSAGFLAKFAMKNWPTLWIVDPTTEKPVLKWAGSVTATELAMLLETATRETSREAAGSAEAAAAWIRGNHAAAEGQREAAVDAYQEALARAPKGWTGRASTVDALASQLQAVARPSECLALCLREWPALSAGTSRLNIALAAIGCADGLPKDAPERAGFRELVHDAGHIALDPKEPVLADDRSSLFEELVEFHRQAGDEAETRLLARGWRDFLDAEAARAPSSKARMVFDSHRMEAYQAVGEAERAIPMLQQSEREFPDDYNPPTRLAKVYLDLGRLDASLDAVRRAEAKVYGPRSLRVLAIEADIWAAMKNPKEERRALERAVSLGDKLGLTGGYRDLLERLRKRAASLPR